MCTHTYNTIPLQLSLSDNNGDSFWEKPSLNRQPHNENKYEQIYTFNH